MTVTIRKQVLAVWLLTAACLTSNADAANFESQIAKLAKDVHTALNAQEYSSCTINIKGPTMYPGSGPSLVTELLGTHLGNLGVAVKTGRAQVGLSGDMKIREVKDAGGGKVSSLVVVITLNFVDRNDNPLLNLESQKINVIDRSEVARIIGIPFEPGHGGQPSPIPGGQPGDQKPPKTAENIYEGFDDPHQHVNGTVIRARSAGLFGIEVVRDAHACPAVVDEGLAYVKLAKTDKCHVRLINDAPYEVAVRLTLDGVDCFWFSKKQQGMWIVPPHSKLTVKGWQIDSTYAREFQIVPFDQSVAAKIGAIGKVGVIAASFHRSYQEHEPYAVGDSPLKSVPPIGIGEGAEFVNRVRTVKRKVGKIRALVPVRYAKPLN
ncbi:MAG: hypothetical protein AB8G99_23700 [Planctomycetaceae bacterium]